MSDGFQMSSWRAVRRDGLTSVLTFSVRVGLGWDGACGGLGRGCMAISCTLLAWRRVPSDEPRDRRSTWSKMEDEERSSSGPLPGGTNGGGGSEVRGQRRN